MNTVGFLDFVFVSVAIVVDLVIIVASVVSNAIVSAVSRVGLNIHVILSAIDRISIGLNFLSVDVVSDST